MLNSIHKAILASFAIVTLILILPISQAHADQILVCAATENAFDALDNNCDGDVDDTDELDNLGLITGTDWYKTLTAGMPTELCTTASGASQCFSSRDLGGCTHSESGGYYCDVSFNNGSSGNGSGVSSSTSNPTQQTSPASISGSNTPQPSGTTSPAASTIPEDDNNSNICAYFNGVEKCLTDTDNGNECVEASGGLFYCSEEPNQQPDSNICVATGEVYNGIDDDCNGEIDEGLEQPSTAIPATTKAGESPSQNPPATDVSAPASAFLFTLGLITLIYTKRKSKNQRVV